MEAKEKEEAQKYKQRENKFMEASEIFQ